MVELGQVYKSPGLKEEIAQCLMLYRCHKYNLKLDQSDFPIPQGHRLALGVMICSGGLMSLIKQMHSLLREEWRQVLSQMFQEVAKIPVENCITLSLQRLEKNESETQFSDMVPRKTGRRLT